MVACAYPGSSRDRLSKTDAWERPRRFDAIVHTTTLASERRLSGGYARFPLPEVHFARLFGAIPKGCQVRESESCPCVPDAQSLPKGKRLSRNLFDND